MATQQHSDADRLPFLPGFSFSDPTKDDFKKYHTLGYKNGYPIRNRPIVGIGGETLPDNTVMSEDRLKELLDMTPQITYGETAKSKDPPHFLPAHVAFDKMVLRFDAYFKETVHERQEQYLVRYVKILYFVEDDSILVHEPIVKNSGIPQGVLIKRQRIPKNKTGDMYDFRDFNLQKELEIYGRMFRIVDCDRFTRQYMTEQGITLNQPETSALDPYTELRNRPERTFQKETKSDKLKKFLQFDRNLLRFYCIWDDRESMFGEMRPFILYYYLVDDTVEVRQVESASGGRDYFPVLLKRQHLPKNYTAMPQLEDIGTQVWYKPEDLRIGETINVFGRKFLIYDCDAHTKRYMSEVLNVEMCAPIDVTPTRDEPPKMEKPPYNGFGSEEDSLGSCTSLVSKPPRKDFIKMLENEHKILRFSAYMDSSKPEDQDRVFVVSYRLADDMMTVYEPPQRNAGIIGGKFLERTRVKLPTSDVNSPSYYTPQHLYVGATIQIFNHKFVFTDADEYCLKYMEENAESFPKSNIAHIVNVYRNALSAHKDLFAGCDNHEQFMQALQHATSGTPITQHEMITVARRFKTGDALAAEL